MANAKCTAVECRDFAVWGWQPFGPDFDNRLTFTTLGSHYRGFPVIKVCDECKRKIEDGVSLKFWVSRRQKITQTVYMPPKSLPFTPPSDPYADQLLQVEMNRREWKRLTLKRVEALRDYSIEKARAADVWIARWVKYASNPLHTYSSEQLEQRVFRTSEVYQALRRYNAAKEPT